MSACAVIRVKELWKTDAKLNLLDKLVMFHWAWEQREQAAPTVIRFKTYARELGVSVNGVKKAVLHLIELRYLEPIAVQVRPSRKLVGDHPVTPPSEVRGDHPVIPGGSPSDPQRDHPVTPFKERNKKKGPAAAFLNVSKEPVSASRADRSFDAWLKLPLAGKPSFAVWSSSVALASEDA